MRLSELSPSPGSKHKKKRVGRGPGSGWGKTAGRGFKGQNSRAGGGTRPGFEGGQMPLHRRLPKWGFTNRNRVEYRGINVDVLQSLYESKNITVVDPEILYANGLVGKNDLVKVLGRGELKAKMEVKAHAFSDKAKEAIEAQGGVASII